MRTGLRVLWCAAEVALAAAACAQSTAVSRRQVILSSGDGVLTTVSSYAQGEIVREIDDPHTGDRWLLMRDNNLPGGPGRLVLVAGERNRAGAIQRPANWGSETLHLPMIRAGDQLIVEEHTAIADAVLEARAMNPAALGSMLNVRLAIGGRVVRAVAAGPGRASIQPSVEVGP